MSMLRANFRQEENIQSTNSTIHRSIQNNRVIASQTCFIPFKTA